MTDPYIVVLTPSIPPREKYLARAQRSVTAQTLEPFQHLVRYDVNHLGAGPMRNKLLDDALGWHPDFIAFLDDDDEFMPHHLETCFRLAEETGADVVVPWFVVEGGNDPFPDNRVKTFGPDEPMHSFGITCLVRAEAIGSLRFNPPLPDSPFAGEDFTFWCELYARGATFVKHPEPTWIWHHWYGNTSGRGDRWE